LNQATKSQSEFVYDILETFTDNGLTRDMFGYIDIEILENNQLSFSFSISSDNGLLHQSVHFIVGKRGGFSHGEFKDGGFEVDFCEDYDKAKFRNAAIERKMDDVGSWFQ
jgi:hypothetical protein